MHLPESVRNLVLVGFMGSGKSSVGREIARRWGFRFIDTDTAIRQKYAKSIPEIFASFGEPHFRDEENRALQDLQNTDQRRDRYRRRDRLATAQPSSAPLARRCPLADRQRGGHLGACLSESESALASDPGSADDDPHSDVDALPIVWLAGRYYGGDFRVDTPGGRGSRRRGDSSLAGCST